MKSIHYIIYMTLAALSFTACQEEDFNSGAKGGICISLTEDAGVDVSTRSTPAELNIPVTDFTIEAKNRAGGKGYSGKLPEDKVVLLDAGTYDVAAYYGSKETLALDAPCYEGSANDAVEVKDGYTTSVELTCKVANALLSIRINEDDKEKFEASFKNPSFQLTVGGKSVATPDITKSFYFPAGSTISKLAFSKEGSDYQDLGIKNWPKEIKAADHIIVTVGIEPAPSGITLTVKKVDKQTVTIEETIPMEWLPKPKVEADGFDGNALTFAETETPKAKLNLELASALQDIKFKFNFEDEQFSLDKEKEYVWSNAQDKEIIANTLGINVSDKSVDLNGLLAKLQTNAGAATTNTIEVDVKANNRWSSEDENANRIYTITCNKPVFRVDAYPGNIWTKEFTMNALREEQVESGDFTKINQNIKYQYSTNQEQWSDLGSDLRQANLIAGTTYYIRGLYRGEVPGEVAEVKTYPAIALENGDMEDWAYTDGPEASWPSKGPFWKRWYVRTNKDESTDGWCSLNYYTTSNNDPKAYCSNSGTEQSSDKHTGNYAAEIKTIGWGNGTTAASPISTIKENTPGELFLGKITNNEREYGISYESRPTNLVFWYKYQPEGSHEFTAKIVIENKNENIILAEEIFNGNKQDSYVEKNISINYKEEYKHIAPTHMYVLFSSGENTNSEVDKASITRGSRHVGNILYIDDISLVYDK